MIILGIVLLVLWLIFGIDALLIIGGVLILIGLFLFVAYHARGRTGRVYY